MVGGAEVVRVLSFQPLLLRGSKAGLTFLDCNRGTQFGTYLRRYEYLRGEIEGSPVSLY